MADPKGWEWAEESGARICLAKVLKGCAPRLTVCDATNMTINILRVHTG